jgi:hypothetical protein
MPQWWSNIIDYRSRPEPTLEVYSVCNGSEKDGKLVALQRETARRSVRGALRASSLGLEDHPRDRMYFQHPHLLITHVGVYGAIAECPHYRSVGSCSILYAHF